MIKAVIFDVDGVLIDSYDANILFFRRLVKAYGYKMPPMRVIRKGHAMPLIDLIRMVTKEKSKSKVYRMWKYWERDVKYPDELVKQIPGCEKAIRLLKRRYKLAIVTNRIMDGGNALYEIGGETKYFDTIVSFGDYRRPKPYPDPLLVAAKRLRVSPKECVYIGDLSVDKMAAKSAGMPFICFAGSKGSHPKSKYTVRKFSDLREIISDISNSS